MANIASQRKRNARSLREHDENRRVNTGARKKARAARLASAASA
jgi:hypothetical protein